MILGQYIQGNGLKWRGLIDSASAGRARLSAGRCALAWTWPVLTYPGDADPAAPRPPNTRARMIILRVPALTVPVEGSLRALPTDPLVRMMTCAIHL
jgi:hypothetical protein